MSVACDVRDVMTDTYIHVRQRGITYADALTHGT